VLLFFCWPFSCSLRVLEFPDMRGVLLGR
jgi:hypothetical protein